MTPGTSGRIGLRGRLALSIAAIVVLAFVVTFVAVYRTTGAQLRSRIDRDLRADVDALSVRLAEVSVTPQGDLGAARRYIAAQPFGPSVRLLIVTVAGAGTVTNEPELVNPTLEPSESLAEIETERAQARELRAAPPGYSDLRLEDAGDVRLLTRGVSGGGRRVATIRAGEPLESAQRGQSEVARTFLLIGALTLGAALLAGYLLASRTAAPLRRMARIATAVDAGDLTHRIGVEGPNDEVRMLAESFDHMLERLEGAFSRQREFVSDASHELRTPLTAIRGQLEVLAREPDPSPQRVREVEQIALRELDHMQRLVDDLLILARLDERQEPLPREIALDRFLAELVEAAPAAGRRVEFAGGPGGTLLADRDRVAQVVRNLLRNAVEHTDGGGTVRLGAEAAGERVRVYVDDDGPGIPASERARVFDRFHRVEASRSRSSGGSGLGLAIARAIVEAHGGTIWIEDSPLGGARIVFELTGFRADH
jgi:two-component system, OmpR family, sensor kinase